MNASITLSHLLKVATASADSQESLVLISWILNSQAGNGESALHIRYVMDDVVPLSPAREIYIFGHWGSCWELLEYLNSTCPLLL